MSDSDQDSQNAFVRDADLKPRGFFAEMWEFMRYGTRWWLVPVILVLLGFGLLIALGGTAAAPFIYTLF